MGAHKKAPRQQEVRELLQPSKQEAGLITAGCIDPYQSEGRGSLSLCKTKQDGTSWKKTLLYIVTRSMTDIKCIHVHSNRYLFLRIQDQINED